MGTFLGENRQNQDIEAWPYLLKATRLDEFKPDHFFNLAIVSSRIATMLRKNPTMKIQPQVDFLDVAQQSFNNVIALEIQQAEEFEKATKRVTMLNSDSESWKTETNTRSLVRKWGRVRRFFFFLSCLDHRIFYIFNIQIPPENMDKKAAACACNLAVLYVVSSLTHEFQNMSYQWYHSLMTDIL